MLQCVSQIKPLLDCAVQALQENSYAVEFARARSTVTLQDGSEQSRLKPPASDKTMFAFVVCLLTEFDSGRRNLTDFLSEYYQGDANESYHRFAEDFLRRFKDIGTDILRNIDPDSFNQEDENKASLFFNAEKVYINSSVLFELTDTIDKFLAKLRNDSYYSQQSREDTLLAVYSLRNALYLKNPKIIRLSWVATKSVLQNTRSADTYLRRIFDLLLSNNII